MSINPANPDLLATAHLDRYMQVWDIRKLVALPEADYYDDEELASVSG